MFGDAVSETNFDTDRHATNTGDLCIHYTDVDSDG